MWLAVGEGLPYALVLVLALALLFSGSPGACCCLYSTLGFILRYSGRKGGEGLPSLLTVHCNVPTIAIIIYNSLYILCIVHESCFILFSGLT